MIHSVEIARNLLIGKMKADLPGALAAVRGNRNDAVVGLQEPAEYYIYPPSKLLRAPAVITICESYDTQARTRGANFVSAVGYFKVALVVEEKDLRLLTLKAERYQAALVEILNQVPLVSDDSEVKIFPIVTGFSFSPEYTTTDTPQSVFRKEVVVDLEVEHYEKIKNT